MAYIRFFKKGTEKQKWLTNLHNNNLVWLFPNSNSMAVYNSKSKHLHDLNFDSKREYNNALKKMLEEE